MFVGRGIILFSILAGFIILITLIIFKVSIVVSAPLASSVIALLNNLNVMEVLNNQYLAGFADFVEDYFFIFLLSAVLGKIMEESGDAKAVGDFVLAVLPPRYAAVGIFLVSAVLTYGGISAFVFIFTIYPIAKAVFEEAGLSKSLILASIGGGIVIVGIPMPGSPQIHNLIMMEYLNTPAVAGLVVGVISLSVAIFFSVYYLLFRTNKLQEEKLAFEGTEEKNKDKSSIQKPNSRKLAKFIMGILPLLTVIIFLAVLGTTPITALLMGVIVSILKNFQRINLPKALNSSISNAASPLMFAASAMGFGQVISSLPLFKAFLEKLINLPLNIYLIVGIITNIAAGLLGSASGGMILTLSTLGDSIVQLVEPETFHRIMVIASTGLDTLPHNSVYLAMLAYTGLSFKETYFDYFIITVLAPLISLSTAVILTIYL